MRFRRLALILGAFIIIAACRASDLVAQYSSRPTATAARARATQAQTPVVASGETGVPTETGVLAESGAPTETDVPTETEAPTDTEVPTETEAPTVVEAVFPTETDVPTETAEPTREFEYLVSYSWCGPNPRTFVEGKVYKDGEPVDGLLVRLAVNSGGDPIVNDYKTGTDPAKPGGYTQIIGANGPRGGLWYLWVIDPQTNKRISDIATVKTDPKYVQDTDQSSGSCQSAEIDFSNDLSTAPVPSEVPSEAPTDTPTLTVSGTPPTNTPTRTGTPTRTVTPTPTATRG